MRKNDDYLAVMDEAIRDYQTESITFEGILETFFNGIKDNRNIKVPYDIDVEKQEAAPAVIEFEDGTVALLVLTNMSEDMEAYAVPTSLRSLVKEMGRKENCDGIIFNPGSDDIFFSRRLIESALSAGYQIAMDEIEEEAAVLAANTDDREIVVKRPVTEAQFAVIEERIRAFEDNTDDFLKISFLHDEDLLFSQVIRADQPEKRHLSFAYDMEDFGWDEPLVLGGVLPLDKTVEILRKICVDGVEPDSSKIEELNHFRKIG